MAIASIIDIAFWNSDLQTDYILNFDFSERMDSKLILREKSSIKMHSNFAFNK